MHGKEPVETMIHVLPVYIMYATAVAGVIELLQPHNFIACISRIYGLLVLGTWFVHVAFILYVPYPWPGRLLNPYSVLSIVRNLVN